MSTIPTQTFNGFTLPSIEFVDSNSVSFTRGAGSLETFSGDGYGCFVRNGNSDPAYTLFAYTTSFRVTRNDGYVINCSQSFTYNNKRVYYGYQSWYSVTSNNPTISSVPLNSFPSIAWLMVFGGYSGYNVSFDLNNTIGSPNNPTTIQPNAVFTSFDFTPDYTNGEFAFNSGSCYIDGDGFPSGTPIQYTFEPETGHLRVGVITSDITIHVTAFGDPYQSIDGESDIPGGDSIPIPSLPSLSAVTSGIIGLFNPTISQMQLLSDYMWTDFGGTGSTTEDILKEIVQAIKRSISNPLDYVIGLNIIPSAGLSVGASTTIRFGFVNSNVSMPRLTSQFFVVDCGTLSFNALCGDTFLDYAPYAKFSIYLPYIGVKDVDANDFVGHTIGVVYHGDVVTGGITAYITKDGSVMYQYSGCCALNIPLTADNWGNTISGAVQIATALITGGITGGSAGVASSAVKSVSSVAANPSLLSPQVSRSGAVSGGAGCMAVQKPFVIREAVRFHSTSGFNSVSGYPSYYFKALSEMHGYTVCYDVHLVGVHATENEIKEIENLLKEGVLL